MKKVLSVLLAAAMVAGMSVTSMAATNTASTYVTYSNNSTTKTCYHTDKVEDEHDVDVSTLEFGRAFVETDGVYSPLTSDSEIHVGDNLFFELVDITFEVDTHWNINIKSNSYVEGASIVYKTPNNDVYTTWAKVVKAGEEDKVNAWVKVEIVDELDSLKSKDAEFKMYISDNYNSKTNKQSEGVAVDLTFDNYKEEYVAEYNDVDYVAKWIVEEDAKPFTAIFDFEDEAYFTVKVYEEEAFILNFVTDSVKAIEKLWDYEADVAYYNFKGSCDEFTKAGELFIPADEDTFIYEVVDGELVEVEATWTKDYCYDGLHEADGWVIETNELGYYVVSDIEAPVEEVEVEETETVETEKANPETGAADFVGAAVALAVVSVAAAGALALKK